MPRVNKTPDTIAQKGAYALHESLFDPKGPDFYSYQGFCDLVAGKGGGLFTLEENNNQIIGYLLFREIGEEAEILSIAVRKDEQKQGFGRILLETLIRRLKSRGCQALFLEVSEKNAAACALYTSLGAETVGKRQNYYKNLDDKPVAALLKKINVC